MIGCRMGKGDDLRSGPILPDVTSLLDILFILIVFFMITAGTVFKSLELDLPQNKAAEKTANRPDKQNVLEISADKFVLNGKHFGDLSEVEEALETVGTDNPEHELVVATDKDVTAERLLKVLSAAKEKGINAAHILVQKEKLE